VENVIVILIDYIAIWCIIDGMNRYLPFVELGDCSQFCSTLLPYYRFLFVPVHFVFLVCIPVGRRLMPSQTRVVMFQQYQRLAAEATAVSLSRGWLYSLYCLFWQVVKPVPVLSCSDPSACGES